MRAWTTFCWLAAAAFAALTLTAHVARADEAQEALEQGNAAFGNEDCDLAIRHYTEAIRLDPKLAEAYFGRGNAYWKKTDTDKALADFTAAIRLNPKDAKLHSSRGLAYAKKGEYDKAIANCGEAIRLDSKDARGYYSRGLAYLESGDRDKAIVDLNEAVQLNPRYAAVYYVRGRAYFDKGDFDTAIVDLTEAIRLYSKYAEAYCCRGAAYRARGDFGKAIADYTEAIQLDPKSARGYEGRGATCDQKGEYGKALADYLEAIRLGKCGNAVYERAVWLLIEHKRYPEAERLIEGCGTRQGTLSDGLRQLQMQLYLARGDVKLSLETARKTAEASSDYRTHLWHGRLLFAAIRQTGAKNDPEATGKMTAEATQAFQRAVELSDKNPETWLPLVQFLCVTGQTERAKAAIAEARKKLPADAPQTPFTMGQCHEALGDLPAAQEQYEAALKAAPDNPAVIRSVTEFYWRTGKPQQADAQLERILGGRVKAEPGDIQWARRVRAAILFGQGGYHNQQRARQLVEQNLAVDPTSTPDLRLKATIVAALPSRAQQEEAVRILEQLAASLETRTNDDWYNLALLYLARDEWGKFNQAMLRLLAVAGDEPRYLTTYIIAALQRNEQQNAEIWLDHLQKVAPNQFNTTALRAELLVRRGKYEEALDLLKAFVGKPAALPADATARRLMAAECLERLAVMISGAEQERWQPQYVREAEELVRQYVKERPGTEELLISFLGRQGKCDEALALLEHNWPRMNPVAISQVMLPLLQPGRPNEEQLQRGERLLKEAVQRFDRPVPLLLAQADLATLYERYEEAETLYREIIAQGGGNPAPVALNNLAVLLAMRGIKLDEALQLINRALEVSGPVGAMLDTRASVYIALKQPDKALADMQDALADAERPERLFHLAQVQHLKGDEAAAAAALRRANKLGLTAAALHPLERPSYRELQKLLEYEP